MVLLVLALHVLLTWSVRHAPQAPPTPASGEAAAPSAQERLGHDIARSARGDCLKGEYAGAGIGLLSLPFWLIAELRREMPEAQ